MPLIRREIQPNGSELFLWKVEEDKTVLNEYPVDWSRFEKIKAPNKQQEWLGRQLLFIEAGVLNKVNYLDNGKPVLQQGYISISHCKNVVGIILSNELVGLDIQNCTEKLFRIKGKFCSANELALVEKSNSPLEDLTRIWSAKEAVFKVYGERIIFADDMKIDLRSKEEIECRVQNRDEAIFHLGCDHIDEFFVVYTKQKRSL